MFGVIGVKLRDERGDVNVVLSSETRGGLSMWCRFRCEVFMMMVTLVCAESWCLVFDVGAGVVRQVLATRGFRVVSFALSASCLAVWLFVYLFADEEGCHNSGIVVRSVSESNKCEIFGHQGSLPDMQCAAPTDVFRINSQQDDY